MFHISFGGLSHLLSGMHPQVDHGYSHELMDGLIGLMGSFAMGIQCNGSVGGRNAAPVGRWFIPLFRGFQPSFWWCRISSSHSMTILEIFFECFCDIPLDKTLQANSRMSQQFNCARCAGSLYQVWLPFQPVSRCAQKDFIFWFFFFTLNASTLVSCKADDCRLHAALRALSQEDDQIAHFDKATAGDCAKHSSCM